MRYRPSALRSAHHRSAEGASLIHSGNEKYHPYPAAKIPGGHRECACFFLLTRCATRFSVLGSPFKSNGDSLEEISANNRSFRDHGKVTFHQLLTPTPQPCRSPVKEPLQKVL